MKKPAKRHELGATLSSRHLLTFPWRIQPVLILRIRWFLRVDESVIENLLILRFLGLEENGFSSMSRASVVFSDTYFVPLALDRSLADQFIHPFIQYWLLLVNFLVPRRQR